MLDVKTSKVNVTDPDVEPMFIRLPAAAKLLDMTPDALRGRLKRGEIPLGVFVRIGPRTLRFDRERLIQWARSKLGKQT